MLQNRVNELDSGILDIVGDKVHTTGFTHEKMLQFFLDTGVQCWSSKGLYDYRDLEFCSIKNNALIIVRKDGKEINRYQYKPVHKDTVHYKNEAGKNVSLTFTIRKSFYSDHYHFLSETDSLLFNNKDELDEYLLEKFDTRCSF
ncbi:hypothetical protein SAMN05421736_1375 [Evansella caseinilytica]|uniref:Uncharacterized protein n=1 Tax=Evansella caseinilytica TaxID=1503961 RepID=A0A1H3V3I1_9BACI|nr:hypothetical protein SAMN05421736_1375 [Evansella caseinilytica]